MRSYALTLLFILPVLFTSALSQGPEALPVEPFHSSYEISAVLSSLAQNNTDIAEYTTAQDLLGTRTIPGNRVIPILFLGDRNAERPWIMLIGAHHGDEPDSTEAVLAFAEHMIEGYTNDTGMQRKLIDGTNIAILPVVNPYGLDQGTRVDENNEDPNRDYPFEPSQYSSHSDGIPLTTAGAHAVHSLAEMYPFSIALSFHTGSRGIFYPWGAPDVGTTSPDGICFREMGAELSLASGTDLLEGPANNYPYVAEITGAFDDHLYGSTFMPDHLASTEMQLPWSTYTATVELNDEKGYNPSSLGDTDELWDHMDIDTRSIPVGVRICYAACLMAGPYIDGDIEFKSGSIEITGDISGVVDIDEITITLDGEEVPAEMDIHDDPLLPAYTFTATVEEPVMPGSHRIEVLVDSEGDWDQRDPVSYQKVAPQSILANSRRELVWYEFFRTEDRERIPEKGYNATIELSDTSFIMEAGEPGLISAVVDHDQNLTLLELVFVLSIDGWQEVTRFNRENVSRGTNEFYISTVPMAGWANLTVNLTFEEGELIEEMGLELVPSLRVLQVKEDLVKKNSWEILVGLQGGQGPTPIFWGVNRDRNNEWDDNDWVIEPQVEIANGYGPHTVDVDLSDHGGIMYFRATTIMDDSILTGRFLEIVELEPEGSITLTDLFINATDDEVTFGPVMVISSFNGLESLGPFQHDIDLEIEIFKGSDEVIIVPMEWKYRSLMTHDEVETLRFLAFENGLDPSSVDGAFFGTGERGIDENEIEATMKLDGSYYHRGSILVSFSSSFDSEIYSLDQDNEGEDEDERDFPVGLFIFLLVVALGILLITYLRYRTHWKDPVPEEDGIPERTIRPDVRRRTDGTKDQDRATKVIRTAPEPPWRR